ncbi:MAG: LysM peptidoglycan-binding domain-containing protein, partial [Oscillospiraceae bacterium]|nr:LysM peptidoglycan-binding domain-containing protein [Oscillospiraceae bacterium]
MLIHVVRPGDTLFSIAAQYAVSPALLSGLNGLHNEAALLVGQALLVRSPRLVHTVAPGDTLYSIARQYGVSELTLYRNNYPLLGRPVLRTGEELV